MTAKSSIGFSQCFLEFGFKISIPCLTRDYFFMIEYENAKKIFNYMFCFSFIWL